MVGVEPEVITLNQVEEWVPVTDPYECACGHLHVGRRQVMRGVMTGLAPQFHLCEDRSCSCTVLRPVGEHPLKDSP